MSAHVIYSVLYLCNRGIFMCISGRETTWRIHSSNFWRIVCFVLLLDSFYPVLFTDHGERENRLSSAAFFELFSSEIIFVCLISHEGIILLFNPGLLLISLRTTWPIVFQTLPLLKVNQCAKLERKFYSIKHRKTNITTKEQQKKSRNFAIWKKTNQ